MMLALQLRITSIIKQTAALARDIWNSINDTYENEHRKWEDII
tara:strand:- start:978 stop:1106 length:129 start_codon:yes stop_codon:yes gene_type:complete